MRYGVHPNFEAASGVTGTRLVERHIDKLVFDILLRVLPVSASGATIANMTGWGLTVEIYMVGVATRAVHDDALSRKTPTLPDRMHHPFREGCAKTIITLVMFYQNELFVAYQFL